MTKTLLLILLVLCGSTCLSQYVIKGQVRSHEDKKPVPYSNIGIINSSVGTISNEDGTFLIAVPEKHKYDTLLFSALGYNQQFIPVLSLAEKTDVAIVLQEKVIRLEEVVVAAKNKGQKSYPLGNRLTQGGFLYADSSSAGAAMALLIENKYPSYHADLSFPVFVETVSFFINKNSIDKFKLRVRFTTRDSITGLPSTDLLSQSVIVTSSIKKGWIDLDMKPYRLVIGKPFFLELEWIMEDTDRLELLNTYATYKKNNPEKVKRDSTIVDGKKVGFWSYLNFSPGTHFGISAKPFSLDNYTCYYRTNSFGEWKRSPVILAARVSVIPLAD